MQGYITLATGSRFYLELAINLALSLKLNDPTRPFCVVLDKGAELPPEFKPFVDHVAYLDPKPGFNGCLNKLRINEVSPYSETMFVDSDCVLVKKDMDRHWAKFSAPGFSIAGGKVTSGHWYSFDIAQAVQALQIPYMVKMNSGVYYFRQGEESDRFFNTTLSLVEHHQRLLGTFHRNKVQLADEPFIGAAMGQLGLEPLGYDPKEGSIMITTVGSTDEVFDPFTQTSRITKHDDYRLLGRFFPKKHVAHSPSFAHFVQLRPKPVYNALSDQLRQHANLPKVGF